MNKDSIFQNAETYYKERYIRGVIPKGWGGWNDKKEKQIIIDFKLKDIKRKDSARSVIINREYIRKAKDSILKK